jgi:hypothetical protein
VLLALLGAGFVIQDQFQDGAESVALDPSPSPPGVVAPPVATPYQRWMETYETGYVQERARSYERGFLRLADRPLSHWVQALELKRRYALAYGDVLLGPEASVPPPFLSTVKRYRFPLTPNQLSAPAFLNLEPFLRKDKGLLAESFQNFSFDLSRLEVIQEPLIHFEAPMTIKATWRNFEALILFWLDDRAQGSPILHWIQRAPTQGIPTSQEFDYTRGMLKLSILNQALEIIYVQTLIAGRPFNSLESGFAVRKFEWMGDEIVESFARQLR